MSREYAIVRTQRIKNWATLARRVNHCERTGKNLPANVDPSRQHCNEHIFPDAHGPAAAIGRWHRRLTGRQTPDILAGEVRNLPLLVSFLNDPKSPLAAHIRSLLPDSTCSTLAGYKRSVTPLEPVKKELVTGLVAVISGPSIYTPKRFKKVRLRSVTKRLLAAHPAGDEVALLNRLLLEDAFRPALNLLAKPRENAVLAVEVFMGMSDDKVMKPEEMIKWKDANLAWLRGRYGAENVIAGAANGDETTPHLHAVIMPMDKENHLNCRDVLGDRKAMRAMQDDYAKAMKPFGLNRGITGSKRQYIPQAELYQFRTEVKGDVEAVAFACQTQLDRLQTMDAAAWQNDRAAIIAEVKQTMEAAQTKLRDMAVLAEEVILLRRDEAERLLFIPQNHMTDKIVAVAREASERIEAEAKTAAAKAVAEAKNEAAIVKQRAEESVIQEKKSAAASVAQARSEADAVKKKAEIMAVQAKMDAEKTVAEKQKETEISIAKAKKDAETTVAEGRKEAENTVAEGKKRADAVLKAQAALVRGLDLVPIAQDIMGVTPVEKDGVFTFTTPHMALQINRRKYEDLKDAKCKGAGAIDLVKSLTGRDFKQAVEFLLPRHTAAVLLADATGAALDNFKTDMATIQPPQPGARVRANRVAHIWKADPSAWSKLREKLVRQHQFDPAMLDQLLKEERLWAVSKSVLAAARYDFEDPQSPLRGVTLWNLDAPVLVPHTLAPQQGGEFWTGSKLDATDTIVGVANPLEALACREITRLENLEKDPSERTPLPLIISLDGQFPTLAQFQRIQAANPKKFILATHSPLRGDDFAAKAPFLYGPDHQLLRWIERGDIAWDMDETASRLAWTNAMTEKIQGPQERGQKQEKQY